MLRIGDADGSGCESACCTGGMMRIWAGSSLRNAKDAGWAWMYWKDSRKEGSAC